VLSNVSLDIAFHDKFINKDFIFDIYLNLFRGLSIFNDTFFIFKGLGFSVAVSLVVDKGKWTIEENSKEDKNYIEQFL